MHFEPAVLVPNQLAIYAQQRIGVVQDGRFDGNFAQKYFHTHAIAALGLLSAQGVLLEWLLRKPAAFARYHYREELFPSTTYRRAYDRLVQDHGMGAGEL